MRCAQLVAEKVGTLPDEVEAAVEQLQPMFAETRYPSGNANEPIPADLIAEGDARSAVEWAEEVMAWVQSLRKMAP